MINTMTKSGKIPGFEVFARPPLAKKRGFPVKSFTVEIFSNEKFEGFTQL